MAPRPLLTRKPPALAGATPQPSATAVAPRLRPLAASQYMICPPTGLDVATTAPAASTATEPM